jgi:Flp pilus assembly pilin Flp
MKDALLKLQIKIQNLLSREEGQDLAEYALVLGVITVGAIALLKTLGGQVATALTNITTIF